MIQKPKKAAMLEKALAPDPTLLEMSGVFPSENYKEIFAAYCLTGTINGAARLLTTERGKAVGASNVSSTIRIIQAKALAAGWIPKSGNVEVDEKTIKKNLKAVEKKLKNQVSTFVITWAQNATPVHAGFLSSLKKYCDHKNALLLVIAGRYKNPTSQWSTKQQNDEYWVDEIKDYLIDNRIELNRNMIVMGDIKTQPTAENPLSGFKSITQDKSGIFGHSKVALESVATPQNSLPKLLTTTGGKSVV